MQRLLWQKVLLLAPAVLFRPVVPIIAAPALASCTGSVAQKWEFGTGLWDGFLVAGNTWFGTVPTAATVPLTIQGLYRRLRLDGCRHEETQLTAV